MATGQAPAAIGASASADPEAPSPLAKKSSGSVIIARPAIAYSGFVPAVVVRYISRRKPS